MVIDVVRSLWAEPRAPGSTAPRWLDALLVAALAVTGVVEGSLREDLAWRPFAIAFGLTILLALPWRRAQPLLVAVLVFGSVAVFDVVATRAGLDPDETLLWTTVWVLALPYALLRWGSGRQIVVGTTLLLVFPLLGHTLADALLGLLLFSSSAGLGAAFRYRAAARIQEVDQVRMRERQQLARELHDTVAHHVSAIAVQAQAGRAVAGTDPERAADVLEVIEAAASRTLAEMRAMVGVLRDDGDAQLAPQAGVADIEQLARTTGASPRIDVQLTGDLDGIGQPLGAALYRLAQESVTNALQHARHASVIEVRLTGDDRSVRLTVHDDGEGPVSDRASGGYGIVGMTERATLLGGTLSAGPDPSRGWTVDAVLPRAGVPS